MGFVVTLAVACSQAPSGPRIKVIDDDTGFVVPAASVHLDVPASPDASSGPGILRLSAIPPKARVQVTANGYKSLSVPIASGDQLVVARLSGEAPPPEFATEALQRLRVDGRIVIAGFVADAATDSALSGARVSSGNVSTETNARGFFALMIPVPNVYSPDTGALLDVRIEKTGYQTLLRTNERLTRESIRKYRLALRPGSGTITVDGLKRAGGAPASAPPDVTEPVGAPGAGAPTLPTTVRVGTDCPTSTTCKSVEVVSLDAYAKHVLPNEWIAAWHQESLKAGSVAVRSIGVWFTAHPKTSTYDVCDSTACQVYDSTSSETSTDQAVDGTTKEVMVSKGTSVVAKAEYAAENNQVVCDDGKTGTDTTEWPCTDDVVCKGQTSDGHGRGMCQKGSNRWATGKDASGNPAPGGARLMDWILTHYYPKLEMVTGS
jgi:hypothetical protein